MNIDFAINPDREERRLSRAKEIVVHRTFGA
jgi:hypothetical protein